MSGFEQARVKVKQGWLQGDTAGPVKIFKGIPYAAPPVGERRFRKPEDPGRWRGVRKAVEYSAAAIQQVMENPEDISNVHGVPQLLAPSQYEEDCLYLNVWTPAKTGQDRLPVFVWVHGGGLVAGSGVECVCDGEGLAKRKDMVVVTINHRLNILGYLDLSPYGEKYKNSGNAGNADLAASGTMRFMTSARPASGSKKTLRHSAGTRTASPWRDSPAARWPWAPCMPRR